MKSYNRDIHMAYESKDLEITSAPSGTLYINYNSEYYFNYKIRNKTKSKITCWIDASLYYVGGYISALHEQITVNPNTETLRTFQFDSQKQEMTGHLQTHKDYELKTNLNKFDQTNFIQTLLFNSWYYLLQGYSYDSKTTKVIFD